MAMTPPMILPTTTDVMPLETESDSATRVSCAISVDVLGVSGVVAVDENDDDDVMLSCVVSGQEFAPSSACAYNYCRS